MLNTQSTLSTAGARIAQSGTRLHTKQPRNHGLILGAGRDFSLLHSVQKRNEAHPASYTMGTVGPFTRNKMVREYKFPDISATIANV
jgi:hypothetical protein